MKKKMFAAMTMAAVLLAACGGSAAPAITAAPATTAAPDTTAALETTAAPVTTAAPETKAEEKQTAGEGTELYVFAAASMTETMDQIKEKYEAENPGIVPKQMNALEEAGSLAEGSRIDLLENKVTLAVPEGNPKGIESFDQLSELLKSGDVFLCMGNSDVPVGQYTQKIFAFYELNEEELAKAGVLTYGSNVKEVTTQVKEGSVDCGIIYATDAFSAGLETVDSATKEMCGQVIYPASVLKDSKNAEAAQAFLEYLTGSEASEVFESVGFTPLSK